MLIFKKLFAGLCTLTVMLCTVIPYDTAIVSANELTDSILNDWSHDCYEEYGDIYSCPEDDCNAGKILDYCISVVNDKKGELITDEYSLFLCFDYSKDMFSSEEDFENYYVWNIYYPLFALYPQSAFCASAMAYYGGDDNGYTIMIELCLNGKSHNYISDVEIDGEVFKGFERYENERSDLADEIIRLADEAMTAYPDDYNRVKYVYDYIVENVEYNADDLRSHTSYGALIDKLAVCQGYSMAMQDVCYLMDIPCIMNFSIEDEHGWNSIYINGKWRFVDATNGLFMTVDEADAPIVYEEWNLYDNYADIIDTVHEKLEYWNNLGISYDVNNDGNTTAEDALMVLNCTIGVYTDNEILIRADVDGDGNVTSYDALLILQSLVGM